MADAQLDAVLAGSRGFALALFVPLTEQVGTRPRVATDPTQALTLFESPRGLVVVEVEGEGTVRSIRELLATRKELTVVAAVPDAQAATLDALRALGVELARWDGTPSAVLGAVSRRLGAAGPASVPAPAPAPVSGSVSAPAPVSGSVSAPVSAPAPAPAPAPVSVSASASVSAPALFEPFAPSAEPEEGDVVSLEDLGLEEAPVPAAAAAVAAAAAPVAPPPASGSAWPAGGLTPAEAEQALARGVAGKYPADPVLRAATEGVVTTLSVLEASVLAGDPVPVTPEPLRRAAVMRLRVAHALAERPPPGSAVDQAALSGMLGEIDGLLSEVATLVQGAPPDVQPSLEAVRNALVKEAIDFSEAAQALAPAGAAAAPAAVAPARRVPATRVLTVTSEPEASASGRRWPYVALALAVVVAGGFHGWRYYQARSFRLPPPQVTGAPARAIGGSTATGSKFITSRDGKPFTDAELEIFRQREELQGRRVQVLSPTTAVSLPATAPPLPVPAFEAPRPATQQGAAP